MAESRSCLKGQQYVIVSFRLTEQVLLIFLVGFRSQSSCLHLTSSVLSSHTNSFSLLTHFVH